MNDSSCRAGDKAWTTPAKTCRRARQRLAALWRRTSSKSILNPDFAIGQRALLLRTSRGQHSLGLHLPAGRCDGGADPRVGRSACDRDLASALLYLHAGLGAQLDCPVYLHAADTELGDASRSRDPPLGRRNTGNRARRDAAPALAATFPAATCCTGREVPTHAARLLSGDIVQVAADLSRVSFLWSYPNMMPLSAAHRCRRIAATLAPWEFERIYGAFPDAR